MSMAFQKKNQGLLRPADNGITAVSPRVQAAIHAGRVVPGLQQNITPGLAAVPGAADHHNGLVLGQFVYPRSKLIERDQGGIRSVEFVPFFGCAHIQHEGPVLVHLVRFIHADGYGQSLRIAGLLASQGGNQKDEQAYDDQDADLHERPAQVSS